MKNTPDGILSGYAWGQELGWIDFSGVTINSSGQFAGEATGDSVGIINFDLTKCTNCGVKTDWKPLSARPVVSSTTNGGGHGGRMPLPSNTTSSQVVLIPINYTIPNTTPPSTSPVSTSNSPTGNPPSGGSPSNSFIVKGQNFGSLPTPTRFPTWFPVSPVR